MQLFMEFYSKIITVVIEVHQIRGGLNTYKCTENKDSVPEKSYHGVTTHRKKLKNGALSYE